MCTVTYIPFGNTCFITSNRDESPGRQATGLISGHTTDWNAIHYPLDEESGGSWIALADSGRAVCLLNGGFEPFVPEPPYRLSRGQVVTSAVSANNIELFLHEFNFMEIAPFTLLIYENDILTELVWDGRQKHIMVRASDQPRIWSSVTLYPQHVRAWRKSFFEEWIHARDSFDRESILSFHQLANGDPDNGFVMNRKDIVKTLSITSIILQPDSSSMLYLDLEQHKREEILIRHEQ